MKHFDSKKICIKAGLILILLSASYYSFSQNNIIPNLPAGNQSNSLVTLVSFTAKVTNDYKTNLNWRTASEVNTSHFWVQRSIDGVNFEDVAIVFTQEGNTASLRQYSCPVDISSFANDGIIYYRLKIVDMKGSFGYSPVETILVQKEENTGIVACQKATSHELSLIVPEALLNKAMTCSI